MKSRLEDRSLSVTEIAGALIDACFDDTDPTTCKQCTDRLVAAGRAALPVLQELATHPAADVRLRAAEALGRIGAPATEDVLIRMVEHDVDPTVREAAIEAVSRFSGERVTEVLLEALHASHVGQQIAAIHGLGRRRASAAVAPLVDLASRLESSGEVGRAGMAWASVAYIETGLDGLRQLLNA